MNEPLKAGASHHIETAGGYPVPVAWYPGAADKPVVTLLPALGVAARFYDKLATTLAESGLNVAVMEQRGQGDSALRPTRRHNWGFAEVLDNDLPALLAWAEQQRPGAPLVRTAWRSVQPKYFIVDRAHAHIHQQTASIQSLLSNHLHIGEIHFPGGARQRLL